MSKARRSGWSLAAWRQRRCVGRRWKRPSERPRSARCSTTSSAEGEPGPRSFQPMNVNFGLLPPVTVSKPADHEGRWRGPEKAQAKKKAMSDRALADIAAWA